jgi:hypothetical protein
MLAWIKAHPNAKLCIIHNKGGFAFQFTSEDGRLACGADVDVLVELMTGLIKHREDLVDVVTHEFADVCSSVLSMGYAPQKIAVRLPFLGHLVVAASDGLTDEAMFEFAEVASRPTFLPTSANSNMASSVSPSLDATTNCLMRGRCMAIFCRA